MSLAFGLALALATAVAFNWAWVAQHTVAAALPPLSVRRPLRSLRLLAADRRWLTGFVTGIAGWALYVAALRLAPLSLVQAASAGGIALLPVFAQRAAGVALPRREWRGVLVAVVGLALLAASLGGGADAGRPAAVGALALWLGASGAVAALAAGPAARLLAAGAGWGIAAGVLYGAGDVATKAVVGGGAWLALSAAVLVCHGGAFVVLQLGFQRGSAVATAGLSSLLTNALPIAAGVLLFHERLPGGAFGALRIAAFACVVAGAAILARRSA